MPVNICNKSQIEAWLHLAQCDAGDRLGIQADATVKKEYAQSFNTYHVPITFIKSWDWSTYNVTIIHPPSQDDKKASSNQQTKEENQARLAMWIGAIATFFLGFVAANKYQHYCDRKEAFETIQVIQKEADCIFRGNISSKPGKSQIYSDIAEIAEIYSTVIGHEYYKSRNYAVLAATALVSSLTLAAGGYLAIPAWITAGSIALFACAVITMINCGAHWNEKKVLNACRELIGWKDFRGNEHLGLIEKVTSQFSKFDDSMNELQQYVPVPGWNILPPGYSRLYPTLPTDQRDYNPKDTAPSAPSLE